MLSRVASSTYWMARYLERADNLARYIKVNAHLILDLGRDRETAQWEPLVRASGDEKDFESRYKSYDEKSVINFLTFDIENPNSIRSCVRNARENARTLREIITSEMWETINSLYHHVEDSSRKIKLENMPTFYNQINSANYLFIGLMESTMSHGEGWHFARIGTLMERADKTARILDVKYFLLLPSLDYVDSPYDTVEWGAVLKSVSGFEMYRKQYHRASTKNVSQFLLFDQEFPRSLLFCTKAIAGSLRTITKMLDVEVQVTAEINSLVKSLKSMEIQTVLNNGMHEFVDNFQANLNRIDFHLYESFFSFKEVK